MNGITFNGKHSFADFNLIMNSKKISTPSKKKIKEPAPGMHSVWDFSTVASNGEITYNQRAIEVQFTLMCNSKAQLHSQASQVAEWLQDSPQSQLIFDDIKNYYYLAEVEGELSINEEHSIAEITVLFIAEPFKTSLDFVSGDIWNTFNFNEDYLQDVGYTVANTLTITLYNKGRLITPKINCSVPMTIIVSGKTYNLIAGDNTVYGLKLQNGANTIIINGTGRIDFIFRAVSL